MAWHRPRNALLQLHLKVRRRLRSPPSITIYCYTVEVGEALYCCHVPRGALTAVAVLLAIIPWNFEWAHPFEADEDGAGDEEEEAEVETAVFLAEGRSAYISMSFLQEQQGTMDVHTLVQCYVQHATTTMPLAVDRLTA